MRISLLILILVIENPTLALDFSKYHSHKAINNWLKKISTTHDQVRLVKLGLSIESREINAIHICDGNKNKKNSLLMLGSHHGDEPISTQVILGFLEFILSAEHSAFLSKILNTFDLYMYPIVNPDGYVRSSRNNARGLDLNRLYTLNSQLKHDANETVFVKKFLNNFKIFSAMSFHAGNKAIFWPNGYSNKKTVHDQVFKKVAKKTALKMKIKNFKQSFYDYKTVGEFIDYAYHKHGIFSFTTEVSYAKKPQTSTNIRIVISNTIQGISVWIRSMIKLFKLSRKNRTS